MLGVQFSWSEDCCVFGEGPCLHTPADIERPVCEGQVSRIRRQCVSSVNSVATKACLDIEDGRSAETKSFRRAWLAFEWARESKTVLTVSSYQRHGTNPRTWKKTR